MKTMLAKAIAMQGAAVKETFAATSMASARNTAWLDKMEVAFNSLTEELRKHDKALDSFVRRFDIYLRHVLNVSIEVPTNDSQTTIIRCFKPKTQAKGEEAENPSMVGHSGASTPT